MKVSNQNGFTLLEVLISMALLAIMMVSIVTITNSGIDTKEKILAEDNEMTQSETALARISDDIYQIYSPLYFSTKEGARKKRYDGTGLTPKIKFNPSEKFPAVSSKGQPIPYLDSPDRQTLVFFTNANRRKIKGSKESNYAWIKYTLRNMEGERNPEAPYELIRYFDPKNIYDQNFKFDDMKASVLLKNIKSMELSYWDMERKKFVDTIREISSDSKIITGIEFKLVWIDKLGLERVTKRIFTPQWPNQKPPSAEEEEESQQENGSTPEDSTNENQLEE